MDTAPFQVVIVGGGFAGLAAARALARAPVTVTLVDCRNHHLFQPLLYQVATATLNPSDIAAPIRSILRGQRNLTVLLADVVAIDHRARRVGFADGDGVPYDRLILAAGVRHSYFGHPDWESSAPGLKSIEDALEIRARILSAFEAAEREGDEVARRAWLTFVIVGGGPTGVELAGAVAEIARHALSRDFRRIDPTVARVILIEAGDRLLAAMDPVSSVRARTQLEALGVTVWTGTTVTAVDAAGLSLGPERIASGCVVWAAGTEASPLGRATGGPLDRSGRVLVAPDLSVPGHPEVFVVGDLAALSSAGRPVPGVAPAALQMGRHAAACVLADLGEERRRAFAYTDKGTLATIGRASAVAEIGRFKLAGYLAWVAWLGVHIWFLIGFRSRTLVLLQWAWAYLTWQRGARLITSPPIRPRATAIASSGGAADD